MKTADICGGGGCARRKYCGNDIGRGADRIFGVKTHPTNRLLGVCACVFFTDEADSCRTNGGVKRLGPSNGAGTSAPSPWKRCKQEETARQGASNSVLMNLLVSGCDVSAGYVCFTSTKPKNATASPPLPPPLSQRSSRFYQQQTSQRHDITAK